MATPLGYTPNVDVPRGDVDTTVKRLDLAVGVGTFGLKSYEPKIGGGIHDLAALTTATRWYSATLGHGACARTYSTSCMIFHTIWRNVVWHACTACSGPCSPWMSASSPAPSGDHKCHDTFSSVNVVPSSNGVSAPHIASCLRSVAWRFCHCPSGYGQCCPMHGMHHMGSGGFSIVVQGYV